MTPTELARARALCKDATPGPWAVHEKPDGGGFARRVYPQRINTATGKPYLLQSAVCRIHADPGPALKKQADAAFIAASRTLVPALLDELAQARAALAERDAELDKLHGLLARYYRRNRSNPSIWQSEAFNREMMGIAAASLASRAGDGEGAPHG